MEEMRRGRWEARSIAGYRRTMDVLGRLGDDDRAVGHPGARGTETPAGTGSRASPGVGSRASSGAGRGRSGVPSLVATQHPARRGAAVAALVVVLVLVAVGIGAFLLVRLHHGTRPLKQAAGSRPHASVAPTVPSTTLPSSYTAVSATSSSATYIPRTASGSTTYSLLVGATTSDCWMSVTSSTGTTVLAQTFAPGATASVSLTGRATIVIGATGYAQLAIGGVPLVLPSGATSPFTVTLVPS